MAKDVDGFDLFFEKNTPMQEKTYFLTKYPKVDIVNDERVHCTSCDCHIGTAPLSSKLFRTHSVLGVTQCNKCFNAKCKKFTKGDDGYDYYCRWCGDGGILLCCSKCSFVFCKNCILINFTAANLDEMEKDDNWLCFSCNKNTLKDYRARHWALQNFIKKQDEIINQTYFQSENELNMALSRDNSICCNQETITAMPLIKNKRRALVPKSEMRKTRCSTRSSTETSLKIRSDTASFQKKSSLQVEPGSQRSQRTSSSKRVSFLKLRRATCGNAEPLIKSTPISQNNVSFSITPSKTTKRDEPQISTFIGTAKTQCDEIIGVMKICQRTINEMSTLTNSSNVMSPQTSEKLSGLFTTLQYLQTYSAGLMKTHQENINEWEEIRKN